MQTFSSCKQILHVPTGFKGAGVAEETDGSIDHARPQVVFRRQEQSLQPPHQEFLYHSPAFRARVYAT